jgi:FlaA1/EpsC-like NDP-sugar epimerase
VFAHHRQKIQLLFAIADAILTVLAFEAAYFTRIHWAIGTLFFLRPEPHILLLAFCAAIWISLGFLGRVYEYMDSANPRRLLANTLRQCGLGTVLVILFQYLLRLDPPLSRSFLLLFLGFSLVLLAIFRWYSPRLIGAFQRGFGSPYHLVIVGSPEKAAALEQHLCQNSPFRIQIIARIAEEDCAGKLPQLLAGQVVDEVIFDVDSSKLPGL